ncbi:hypothetical protein [Ornithinimicrobium panacihumi]|uniref:hypothetical protein n=1 Tax=Ornithinimicrobium panacihumi TaxID=2008449 RepID=UPI003F89B6C3
MPADGTTPDGARSDAARSDGGSDQAGSAQQACITLLGPQRNPRLRSVISTLDLEGRHFATITAGWRDREDEDALLVEELGGRTTNLLLWNLMQQVWEADPELARADRERRTRMGELQSLYLIGVEQAAAGLQRIHGHQGSDELIREIAVRDAFAIIRDMDERHLARVEELHHDYFDRYQPQHRDAVAHARYLVGEAINGTDAVVITGGHVGVLLGAMHLFNIGPALAGMDADVEGRAVSTPNLYRPIIAWGAGAMVLTERVLLFYDNSVTSPGVSEMLMRGLGLTRGIVALPSARDRLDLKDSLRMRLLAERCRPATPLLLDEHAEVTLRPDGTLPPGARMVAPDGTVTVDEGEGAA